MMDTSGFISSKSQLFAKRKELRKLQKKRNEDYEVRKTEKLSKWKIVKEIGHKKVAREINNKKYRNNR